MIGHGIRLTSQRCVGLESLTLSGPFSQAALRERCCLERPFDDKQEPVALPQLEDDALNFT